MRSIGHISLFGLTYLMLDICRAVCWNNPILQILSILLTFTGAIGLTKFRDGIKTVDSAEEKFTNLKKDVVSYLRSAILPL